MQPIVNIAMRAAKEAGDLIEQAFEQRDRIQVQSKGLNDYVSDVDRAAERIIIEIIQKAHPDHAIIAEESGTQGDPDTASHTWVIDPLDGTTNFLHGIPHFAVSIAILQQGKVEHAVVYNPIMREAYSASRGRGTQLNGHRLRVTTPKTLDDTVIGTGFPFRPDQTANIDQYLGMFKEIATSSAGIRRAGAASLDLAYVAAGRLDGFWEHGLQPWDIAAGCLLITEAGGLVGDFTGGNKHMDSGNIVAGNPKLFKALLQKIQPHLNDELRK